jgi:predicted ATPase/class 3 adenylate cyclase/Tfp pilus assembly protein PilF
MTFPSGTLTFLFTDIEGSTRLWEAQPETMRSALARHDALLRSAIEENGGHVFKTVGDAFCAAFPTAPSALAAALHVQRALVAEAELAPLHVRMALHTGTAEQRDGDYFGPPLNRVARLLAAGHGGQVLLSNTTRELVRDSLPEGTGLRDLGEHRLKDLVRPEHIFQLDAAGLPPEHPPLKSLNPRPHNLPVQPTPLIGRERELREILEWLQGGAVRLLTLTGPGGTGKTRLALQAAAELVEEFPDGVFFVNLAPVRDAALVPSAIAQVLGVREAGGRPLAEILQEHLGDKRLLLVLDNFEQITDAAPVVAGLLSAAPGLQVLATSRIALRLRGEQEFGVPPLSLPDPKRLPRLEQLTQYDAVRLFLERARAVKPDFMVSNENAPAVAEICHRLDGLPLAIELAASRIRILPPQAMLARLQSRLKLLTGGARDLPQRHQTLRGAIAWSYDLLSEGEQVLFRRLSVFAGGRTLEAIEQVCNAEGELDVIEGVSSLVEKSLLRQEEDAEGEPRFVMLETIHEFAREALDESGEAADIRRRHAEFFLALAQAAEQHWYDAEQGRWLARMETEHDNFRAALRGCLDAGQAETAGLMAETLWTLWYRQNQYREGRQWLQDVLSAGGLSSRTRAAMLYGAGVLARLQGDFTAARPLLEESLSLSREQEDMNAVTRALIDLGAVAAEQDDLEHAEALYEEAAARSHESGKHRTVATVLNNLGNVATRRFDYARAESLYRESLVLARQLKDASGTGLALANLGYVTYRQGDLSGARTHLREALRSAREAGFLFLATHGLAHLAEVESTAGAWERAARLFGVAEARFAAMGSHVSRQRREAYDQRLAAVRDQLGESAWEQARQEGAALPFEEAIAYALGESAPAAHS